MKGDRWLVVNADDFGFTSDVNAGIVEAHQLGILTATTLMANGGAFDDAVRLAKANRLLDIGVHLVLVSGESLVTPGRSLPRSIGHLIRALMLGSFDVYAELRAQIARVLNAGLAPTHLDTHKHTHLLPRVLNAVARLCGEFGIRWLRRPFDVPLGYGAPLSRRLTSRVSGLAARRFGTVLAKHGCRSTDHFAGFQITGRFDGPALARLLAELPEGSTELMCHPGRCTAELRAMRTRLKESRQRELAALTSPEVRRAIEEGGIRLAAYRDLP